MKIVEVEKSCDGLETGGFFLFFNEKELNSRKLHEASRSMVFLKSGFIHNFSKSSSDGDYYSKMISTSTLRSEDWGVYYIDKNVIKAILPYTFVKRGTVSKYCLTHYEGILVGKDSISNWRMIPPFPINIDYELNKELIRSAAIPRSFTFFRNDLALQVDTVGAWFNKFLMR